jgi:lysine 2,3-aminomutase
MLKQQLHSTWAMRPKIWQDVDQEIWSDWHWQLANRISTVDELAKIIDISKIELQGLQAVIGCHENQYRLRFAVTPYYASLIANDQNCPCRKRAVPTANELVFSQGECSDPLSEEQSSPVSSIVHRYPDRVLFLVTEQCAMYCRHCTRRRKAGANECGFSQTAIDDGIAYIRNHSEVRDVLISGGDPLTLSTKKLENIIANLFAIEHVEVIRIGTSIPVTMPQRIDDELVMMLQRYKPIFINTHFNHSKELTEEAAAALAKLANAGCVLGNQSVLLKGINDSPQIMKELVHGLVRNRVWPYYLHMCDFALGLSHFRTSIEKGIEIIESLQGHTSGFCVPKLAIDIPGGGGKIPVGPNYIIGASRDMIELRNYKNERFEYLEQDENTD